MHDVEQALGIVLDCARPLPETQIPLGQARYRTLSRPIATDIDQPPFDRSLMDGYAVRAADTNDPPVTLNVVEQIPAGVVPKTCLQPGQAAQINTGAAIPAGADAVVRVERTRATPDGAGVEVLESVISGHFITRRGTYRSAGETVLPAGAVLNPVNLAVAAAAGAARVFVHRAPKVAVLVTGDELVDFDQVPSPGRIRNSNRWVLESLIQSMHCTPVVLEAVEDDRQRLCEAITQAAASSDVVCVTGGVSMGAFDFVPGVLRDLGATIHVDKLAIKPGRPTLFATLPEKPLIFALPGNPVSAFVGFQLLVAPALSALQGRRTAPQLLRAVLRGSLPAEGRRRAYYPAGLLVDDRGGFEARLLSWQGSGDVLGMAGAHALVMRLPGSPAIEDGETVLFVPLGSWPS